MGRLKDALAIGLLGTLCAYAAWQKLEILSIVTMLALVGIIYKGVTAKALNLAFDLLSSTRQAKFGDLEVSIDQKLQDFSELAARKATWMQILLSQLSSEHIGLLFTIHKAGKYSPPKALKEKLSDLRSRGLLQHNATTLTESTQVWLTDLGEELAEALLESPIDVETLSAEEHEN